MTIRRLLGLTAIYGMGDVLLFGISYVAIIPILARSLSPEEYGIVAALASVGLLLLYLFQMGLPSAAFRYYFLYESPEERKGYLGSIWLVSLLSTLVLALAILGGGEGLWNRAIRNAPFSTYAKYVVWGAFFQVIIAFKSILLRAQERPKLFVLIDVSQFLTFLFLVYYFVAVLDQGVIGQVRAAFLTYAVFGTLSAGILCANVRLRLNRRHLPETARFAGPVLAGYLVSFFASRANVLIVQHYVAGAAVGFFALGQQLGNLIQMGFASFEKAWQPYFYSRQPAEAKDLLPRILLLASPVAMGAALALGLFAPELVRALAREPYEDAWMVAAIVAVGAMFIALSSIVNGGIYYAKRSGVSTLVSTIGAAVNMIACVLLARAWGAVGAAGAAVLSGGVTLVLMAVAMDRLFGASVNYARIANDLLVGFAVLAGGHLLLAHGSWTGSARLAVQAGALLVFSSFACLGRIQGQAGKTGILRHLYEALVAFRR
jgi:O-antigen/teichoic acid export membrane protein